MNKSIPLLRISYLPDIKTSKGFSACAPDVALKSLIIFSRDVAFILSYSSSLGTTSISKLFGVIILGCLPRK